MEDKNVCMIVLQPTVDNRNGIFDFLLYWHITDTCPVDVSHSR
jgi:hypothetical protein